jgi:hypothetical protein
VGRLGAESVARWQDRNPVGFLEAHGFFYAFEIFLKQFLFSHIQPTSIVLNIARRGEYPNGGWGGIRSRSLTAWVGANQCPIVATARPFRLAVKVPLPTGWVWSEAHRNGFLETFRAKYLGALWQGHSVQKQNDAVYVTTLSLVFTDLYNNEHIKVIKV